ncbi:MAG: hypothetical protein ABI667_07505 [Sphingomicrobium sp.]
MAALIGLGVALAVVAFARIVGFDRERVFYPTVLIVVAHYYLLFAAVGGKAGELGLQFLLFGLFSTIAVIGFRISRWFVVAGLALHGLFDFAYQFAGADGGVPDSWPSFCLTFDLAAAAALAILLINEGRHAPGRQL